MTTKTAVITGASRGIGKAIAMQFAAAGYDLVMTSRNDYALYQATEDILNHYPACTIKAKAFDLAVKTQAQDFGVWVLEQVKAPDVLVNNAGLFKPGSVHNEAHNNLEEQLAENLLSAYRTTRSLLPAMMAQKSGHIFNMCSIASLKAYENGGAYSISKFALYGFNQNLREELKPFGIKVTAVIPGAVLTDSWQGFDNSDRRIMEADDIARLVVAATALSPQACVEEIVIRPQLGDL
jgi:short-subunit dehydrogenase